MKVYVAKILIDGLYPSFKIKLSRNFEELRQFADKAIDDYALEYHGTVIERSERYFMMQSGTTVVTIALESQEI